MEIQHFITRDSAEKAASAHAIQLNAEFADNLNNAIKVITKTTEGQTLIDAFKYKIGIAGDDSKVEITDTAIIIESSPRETAALEYSDYNLSSLAIPMKSIPFNDDCKVRQTKLFLVVAIHSLMPKHELITDRIEYGHGWHPHVFSVPKDFAQACIKDYYYCCSHSHETYGSFEEYYPSFSYGLLIRNFYYIHFHTPEPDNSFILQKKCELPKQEEKLFNISSWG